MPAYDRAVEDLGNIVALEHVNVMVPDQRLATLFYATGLGLTRDPFLFTGVDNMWMNVGRSQFHLPTGGPQVFRGRIGLVVADLDALVRRLEKVRPLLAETHFSYTRASGHVDAVCPWGNMIRCHAPDERRFGRMRLGMPYVEFDVPAGSAAGIAAFYREILRAPARVSVEQGASVAYAASGQWQELRFRESTAPQPAYDGHHLQVYVAKFSQPYFALKERGLICEESDQHQYRFRDIVDPASGKVLFAIEHEIRSMRHPLYARTLINRNPAQINVRYAPGYDAVAWDSPLD